MYVTPGSITYTSSFTKKSFSVSRIGTFWGTDGRTHSPTDGRPDHPYMCSFLAHCAKPINEEQPKARLFVRASVWTETRICVIVKKDICRKQLRCALNKKAIDLIKQILTLVVGLLCVELEVSTSLISWVSVCVIQINISFEGLNIYLFRAVKYQHILEHVIGVE